METCEVILCDVDGVINIFADEGFDWDDIQSQRILIDGKATPLFVFSPTVAKELTEIKNKIPFFWLTSWNEKTQFLSQLGFPEAHIFHVGKGWETESKIAHVAKVAEKQKILWIDDFAQEWWHMLPTSVQDNVVSLQPDHRQGLSKEELQDIRTLCGLL